MIVPVAAALLAAAIRHAPAWTWTQSGPPSIVVGTQRLQRCTPLYPGYCAKLVVPLNWLDVRDGTIAVRFEWIPARDPHATATIVAQEGGPGYASTGSANLYVPLFAPLLGDHNLLLMDERGTGASSPIDCRPLQNFDGEDATGTFHRVVAGCGAQLNRTFQRLGGGYVHASDLFGTSQSVRDLSAILRALDRGPVDFYGDSYGSFFGQVFASRYPSLVRSLVLDSTYATLHQHPFDPYIQAMIRGAYDEVCRASLACAAATHGRPADARIHALALRLSYAPLIARTATPQGRAVTVRVRTPDLETLLAAGGYDYGPFRNLDAAARAWLERGDATALARLFEWTTVGPAFYSYDYREYSFGMELADECTVYTNSFDIRDPIVERRMQYAQAVARLEPSFGYPVPNEAVLTAPDEGYDECLTWPEPVVDDPIVTVQPPIVPATLPVLILSGELDVVTSRGDNEQAQRQLGSSAHLVPIPNMYHTPALADPFGCASRIVRTFVVRPLAPIDAGCTRAIPEVRAVGVFPTTLADQPLPTPLPGNRASPDELRLAALGVETLGDAIFGANFLYAGYRPNCGPGYCGVGMRGGTYAASADVARIALDHVAYSNDTTVTGKIVIQGAAAPGDPGSVMTRNVVAEWRGGVDSVTIDAAWNEREPHAAATIEGTTASGHRLRARVPAPT